VAKTFVPQPFSPDHPCPGRRHSAFALSVDQSAPLTLQPLLLEVGTLPGTQTALDRRAGSR